MRIMGEHCYKIYGLNIKSEIKLDEAIEVQDKGFSIDARVYYGSIDEKIKSVLKEEMFIKTEKGKTWFYVKDVATFFVNDGKEIVVEPDGDLNLVGIKSYILGSIMGHLLYQRNVLAIHGGSVVIDNKAVIIVGESGSGKSTVTTALRLKGYKLLTDDIASVSMDKEVFVNPGYPGQRLCDNVMNYFNYDLDKYRRIDLNHKVKYMIPTWEEFVYEKTNLGTICELKAAEVDEPFIEEIKGRDKVNLLYDNGYILRWVRHLGMKPDYVRQCIQVAKQVKMYRITRPKTGFTVGEQVELLESILFKAKSEELKYIIA